MGIFSGLKNGLLLIDKKFYTPLLELGVANTAKPTNY